MSADTRRAGMDRKMSDSQRAYEQKRAQKAGMSLDKWLASKEREKSQATAARKPEPPKAPGLLGRLLDRAHKPLKSKSS
jgi:capsid protein